MGGCHDYGGAVLTYSCDDVVDRSGLGKLDDLAMNS